MNRKPRTLSPEDGRAVDLILDHGAAHRAAVTEVAAGASQHRVAAVNRLLSKLAAMPAAEPPVDLLARTLARTDAAGTHVGQPQAAPSLYLH